jgi:hypothetical protein
VQQAVHQVIRSRFELEFRETPTTPYDKLRRISMRDMQSRLKELDGWVRNRLRYCIWTDWKKPERKRKNLIRLGIPKGQAYAWSRTRMGGWAVAQSPILGTTITVERLIKRGYQSMFSYYEKVSPQLNEPSRCIGMV